MSHFPKKSKSYGGYLLFLLWVYGAAALSGGLAFLLGAAIYAAFS